jgi:glycosidase
MSVNPEYKTVNAEAQLNDPNSTFNHWSRVLALRKKYLDVFVYGDFKMVDRSHDKIFAFSRQFESQKAVVVCNWSPDTVEWTNPEGPAKEILMNNYSSVDEAKGRFNGDKWLLKPYEAIVLLA